MSIKGPMIVYIGTKITSAKRMVPSQVGTTCSPVGSGLVSEPCRSGTPAYMLKSKIRNKTYCHMPRSFGPYLPAWEGSDAATCSAATDLASLLGRAPALPRAPRPQTRLLAREGSDAAT
jgi:hypothetical protein